MNIFVQFDGAEQKVIVSYFGSEQDPDSYENLGEVGADDKRWKYYFDMQSDFLKQYLPQPT